MGRPSAATVLRTTLGQAAPALAAASAELWRRPGLRHRYPAYLSAMHGVIRASVPLMRLAARRCAERAPGDPVAGPLRRYLHEHLAEEQGHDDWLLADLAALGADPGQPLAGPPAPAVARLVGPQYYWVEHHHPVALLGYIAVMESNAPSRLLADWIVRAAGVPVAAVRTVREHADLDAAHTSVVFDLLDALPLTAAHGEAVAISGLHTADALMALFAYIARPPGREPAGIGPDQPRSSTNDRRREHDRARAHAGGAGGQRLHGGAADPRAAGRSS